MARRGWSSANFFRYASGVATAAPITISCWGKTSITGAAQLLVGLFTSGSAANRNAFSIQVVSTNTIGANTSSGTAQSQAVTSTTISADTWFHACGVFASATSRAAYLNGGGKGTETTSRVPSGIDRTSVGVGDGSSAVSPFAPAGTGDLAEVAIWNIDLTDAEVLLLSKGISPLLVRPGNLVGYWPLVGNTSPEINYLSSAAVLSMQGTVTTAAHPRVIMPRRLKTGRTFAAAGSGAISGASTVAFSTTGTLVGSGALSGPSTVAFSTSGTLTGAGALSGSLSVDFTNAGTLTGAGALIGATSFAFTVTGTGLLLRTAETLTVASSPTITVEAANPIITVNTTNEIVVQTANPEFTVH